jgi:hypothetical protein
MMKLCGSPGVPWGWTFRSASPPLAVFRSTWEFVVIATLPPPVYRPPPAAQPAELMAYLVSAASARFVLTIEVRSMLMFPVPMYTPPPATLKRAPSARTSAVLPPKAWFSVTNPRIDRANEPVPM